MAYQTLFFFLLLICTSSCYDKAYQPSYIISQDKNNSEETSQKEMR